MNTVSNYGHIYEAMTSDETNEDSPINPNEVKRIAFVKEQNKKNNIYTFLDIGCAHGGIVLSNDAKMSVGLDIAKTVKTQTAKKINFVLGNGELLPFKGEVFDAVSCMEMIEHIDNCENLLSGIYRILKDNGVLILSTPNRKSPIGSVFEFLKENKMVRKVLNRPIYDGRQHVRLYSKDEVKKELERQGFIVSEIISQGWGFINFFKPIIYGRFRIRSLQLLFQKIVDCDWKVSNRIKMFDKYKFGYIYTAMKVDKISIEDDIAPETRGVK